MSNENRKKPELTHEIVSPRTYMVTIDDAETGKTVYQVTTSVLVLSSIFPDGKGEMKTETFYQGSPMELNTVLNLAGSVVYKFIEETLKKFSQFSNPPQNVDSKDGKKPN